VHTWTTLRKKSQSLFTP